MRRTHLVAMGLSSFTLACPGGSTNDGDTSTSTTTAEETAGDGDGDGDPGDGDGDGDGDTGSCGDGMIDEGEECDLGFDNSFTGQCTVECTLNVCGDGYLFEGMEVCDDGNADNTDDCVGDCVYATCGDGFVEADSEECDDGNDDDLDECDDQCTLAVCGDGTVQTGEECDDGNMDTTDDCPACEPASCGDGYLLTDDEQCDDGNMDNTDACLSPGCTPASCGDGYLWADMEGCDDGNLDDDDDCPTSCEPASCGDGFLHGDLEECDDGNNDANDGCSPDCIMTARKVFVSSALYDGNLGGLVGADQKCQTLAEAANLSGTFMAWVSTTQESPSTRFTQSNLAYELVDGTMIAANWADLIDGTLDAPINMTETGGPAPIGTTTCGGGGQPTVWSGTEFDGTYFGSPCANFQSDQVFDTGLWGNANNTNTYWTHWCSTDDCSLTSAIYCFQQ